MIFNNGIFTCQDVTERAIDDLRNGNGPTMEIKCVTPFNGKADELADMAVDFLNEKFHVDRRFNTIYEAETEWLAESQCVKRVVFQMCWLGF